MFQDLVFYSTPLSPNYENVFDGYEGIYEYREFLRRNYDWYEYENPNKIVTARQWSNGKMSIQVKMNYYETQHYNYCELLRTDGGSEYLKYYFITDVSSINESDYPTVILTLELDVFTDSYLTNKDSSVGLIKQKHYKFFDYDGDLNQVKYSCPVDNVVVDTQYVDNGYEMIWLKITTTTEIYRRSENDYERFLVSTYSAQASAPIFYAPFCVIRNGDIRTDIRTYRTSEGTYLMGYFANNLYNSLNVVTMELTAHSPAGFYVSNDGTEYYVTIGTNATSVKLYENDGSGHKPLFEYLADSGITCPVYYIADQFSYAGRSFNIRKNDIEAITYADNNFEYAFPFKYKSIMVNKDKFPCIFNDVADSSITVSIDTKLPFPSLSVYKENESHPIKTQLLTSKEILRYVDSYDQFMLNNGTSLQANAYVGFMKGLVGAAGGIAQTVITKNPSGAVSAAESAISALGGIVNTVASQTDANNAVDEYRQTSFNALSDIYQLDRVILTESIVRDTDEMRMLKDVCKRYGFRASVTGNPYANVNNSYDYVEADTIKFSKFTPIFIRERLSEIFKRGVTKWHIQNAEREYGGVYQTRYFVDLDFERIVNPEISVYNYLRSRT